MAKVGAQRAAVLTGKSKSTIQRAMNSGKLSFELDQNKRRVIDVSELERVFGIKQQSLQEPQSAPQQESLNIDEAVEKERMSMTIKMLEQQLSDAQDQLDDIKDQRDKWEKQASQVLITSQYTQKQAEEYKEKLDERERKEEARRKQMLEAKMKRLKGENENSVPAEKFGNAFSFFKKKVAS